MNKITLNIKKGDSVKVLAGKEKSKTGKVLEVFPARRKVVVEGLNKHTRFSKSKKAGEKGQKIEFSSAMDVSKLMLICPSCGKTTRVGREVTDQGNFRKCKKCGKRI
jgi:large subunit ribosomal protein L24